MAAACGLYTAVQSERMHGSTQLNARKRGRKRDAGVMTAPAAADSGFTDKQEDNTASMDGLR